MTVFSRALAGLALCLLVPTALLAADDATIFRVFLTDGTAVVSFGEYARVGDSVMISMPVGGSPDQPRLQLVTLAASSVDWRRTDAYADAARAQHYALTRGEQEFQTLNDHVARALNDIALTTDRSQALAIANAARRTLSDWPRQHYGYRQSDVQEIVGLLDEAIAGLRPSGRTSTFELALVAEGSAPPEPVLGMPTRREQLDQILHLARRAGQSSDRVALLQSALTLLGEAHAAGPSSGIDARDISSLRRSVEATIRDEEKIDARYADLARRLTAQARRAAARADVGDVQEVLEKVTSEDSRLSRRRPQVAQALRASIQMELDAARRLRLQRDRWLLRRRAYRDYRDTVGRSMRQLLKARPQLEAIRRLEGPPPDRLAVLRVRLSGGAEWLERLTVAADLQSVHGLLISAWRFADRAATARSEAIASGNVGRAWEASSSAAGAILMLSRTQQELRTLLERPQLP